MKSSTLDYTRFELLKDCLGFEFLKSDSGDLIFGPSRRVNTLFIRVIWILLLLRYTFPAIISVAKNQPYLVTLNFSFMDFCWLVIVFTVTFYIRPRHSVITQEGLFQPTPEINPTQIVWISRRRTWTGRHRIILQTILNEYLLAEFLNRRSAEQFEQIVRDYLVDVGHPAGLELYPRFTN